jgi:hypothetical protein
MPTLSKALRSKLEATVKRARELAETAAREALDHLGVGSPDAEAHLIDVQRKLRNRLRAHGRQVGDERQSNGCQAIVRLTEEVAYAHWHQMLFARFLAENGLLMHPTENVPLTLAECEELADYEDKANGWRLTCEYASRMLPQIFRPGDPALALEFPPNRQRELEKLLGEIPVDVFTASDALGWVY